MSERLPGTGDTTPLVLVTGSNGFLGVSVVERLVAHGGCRIRCLVRTGSNTSRLQKLAQDCPDAGIEIVTGSLASVEAAAAAVQGAATVYHLAAGLRGAPADLFANTVVATKNLLEAMVHQPVAPKLVLVSSFGVYGTATMPRNAVVTEQSPLEPSPELRDVYSFAKLRQEQLVRDYQQRFGFPLVVLRPGVIYGPYGPAIPSRVGLQLGGLFLHLGGSSELPLTFVTNCAEATVQCGQCAAACGRTFNVVDEGRITSRQYLRAYRRAVRRLRTVSIPYPAMWCISRAVQWYSRRSNGQIPPVFTAYKTATTWRGNRFDRSALAGIGYKQLVSTADALARTFEHLRTHRPAQAAARPRQPAPLRSRPVTGAPTGGRSVVRRLRHAARAVLSRIVPRRVFIARRLEGQRRVFLTFDDGPDPVYTPRVLDVLRDADIRATFFLIGSQVYRYPEIARRIAVEGHTIGSHSYTHGNPTATGVTDWDLHGEVRAAAARIQEITADRPRLYRPPFGRVGPVDLARLWTMGQIVALWTLDPRDYEARDDAAVDAVCAWVRENPPVDGDIVLLHDTGPAAERVVAELLRLSRTRGLSFGTLGDVRAAGRHGTAYMNGVSEASRATH